MNGLPFGSTIMNDNASPEQASQSGSRSKVCVIAGVVILAIAVVVFLARQKNRPENDFLEDARSAFAQRDYEHARALAAEILKDAPESSPALEILGLASLQLGHCADAERSLRRVLETSDGNLETHKGLLRLLKMEGRFRELQVPALALLRGGDSGNEFLMVLAAPDSVGMGETDRRHAEFCRSVVPDDPLPLLGVARFALENSDAHRSKQILQEITTRLPNNLQAQALYGRALLQLEEFNGFRQWHNQLPAEASTHPEIWFVRGAWARRTNQNHAAIRCFWEALLRDPNHQRACFQLSQLLVLAGDHDHAKPFAERARMLEEVARLATRGNDTAGMKPTATVMHRIAVLMEKLGRLWEAAAWCRKTLEYEPQLADAQRALERLKSRLDELTPLTLADANPARAIDFLKYPLPEFASNSRGDLLSSQSSNSTISFVDRAKSLGLEFQFYNGADPASGRARMFEFSGGGVAALDYDGDCWPDLYFTQGCSWPPSGSGQHIDRLFRNVYGERFDDVTIPAGLGDRLYGQGVTVGDYDNDGFPDLYVANIGANRLYRNNGDGTFSEVGETRGVAGSDWTLSCLLGDVNGDGHPDLYCVNYLSGDDVYSRICLRDGRPVQCPLHYFPSAQDRLYLNLGDGRFKDVTESSGIALPEGKGMGIVAGDFDRSGTISLFVANDDKPNFFFVNQPKAGDSVRFADYGVQSGLAFGDLGKSQSSMGVAAGDVNNDGRLDLFVTNYAGEPNNLFLQHSGTLFEDVCRRAGLHLSTLAPMGWGTQFVDGDLDGLLDLVVANGHLDENTARPLPYKTPAQFFRNLGKNRFEELLANRLGSYFQQPRAGRAVARVDWNRDGANDVCVTHVGNSVAILTNTTEKRGHHLNVHLRGVTGSRDAIGSMIRIRSGVETWFRHLTAGDGFQASNERILNFGFGGRDRIDELTVFWPSGRVQTIDRIAVDQEVFIVEGKSPRSLKPRH